MSSGETRADALERELAWLERVIEHRFAQFRGDGDGAGVPAPPALRGGRGPYARALADFGLDASERLVLILALAPHVAPELLDPFLLRNEATGRRFTEFGGAEGQAHSGFLPSVETALFLLAGNDRAARTAARRLVASEAKLLARGLLTLDPRHPEEPGAAALLGIGTAQLERLLTGEEGVMRASERFPAERITTQLDWSDLVLDAGTRGQIDLIGSWIRHSGTLLDDWGLRRRIKPGHRCLFYGGPGTGKTLTATLLGKHYDLPVYRVDLSRVVSKWVGETEKNLAALFDQAQHSNWILFFDEAEALFGKRSEAATANDRAANQQIAYLLQRLEDFPGLVILSTNLRHHMDEAFARRFQAAILFPMPDAAARERLWRDMFGGGGFALAPDVDFAALAAQHELAGGAILNVLRHACLRAVTRDHPRVERADVMSGIREEYRKEGRHPGA